MARNSKRNAFTIVELVIVIAVIAILSTVLITTFTGVIESANVSADKQLLSTLNTQLSMHIGKGNDIETVDDLKTALNTQDINYWEKLDPKSAQYGYHYWYDSTKQEIVLATYEELAAAKVASINHEPIARFLGAVSFAPKARAIGGFEAASPRALDKIGGFYFLDQKGENANEIADFYAVVENMSKESEKYEGAVSALKTLSEKNGKNKALAAAIYAKISATAIVTDKGVFINAADTTQKIENIYIPENLTGNADYYLSHEVVNVANKDVNDLTKLDVTVNNIVIPENIKVGEGALNGFGGVNVEVNVDSVEKLGDIFSAGAVDKDATVTLNNGTSYTIDGAKVKDGDNVVETLTYRNPVTSFDMSATGNVVIKTENNYIALDTIKRGISLTLTANNFVGADENLPLYKDIDWTADNGVTVDDYGVVTFPADFNADTVTFTGTATAVNEGSVVRTFTVNVVRVKNATVSFTSSTTNTIIIANGEEYTDTPFRVDYDDSSTFANFGDLSLFKYAENRGAGKIVPFTDDEIESLGCTTPSATYTTTEKYFTVSSGALTFTKVGDLAGSIGTQMVTVKVSDKAGDVITATVEVTINDNTAAPFKSDIPTYSNDYVYKVGNGNPITLGEFFAKKPGVVSLEEYSVYVYNTEADGQGFFYDPIPSLTIANPTEDSVLNFAGLTGTHWIVIGTNAKTAVEEKTVAVIEVEVIPGTNITADSDVFAEQNGGTYNQTIYTTDVVLHDNIILEGNSKGSVILLQNGAALYGNYFEIEAKKFYDADSTTADKNNTSNPVPDVEPNSGYGLITMYGNSEINNLILDGPVYPEVATGSSTNGYYFFGVVSQSTGNVINDSYLFGFASPVRVQGNGITINDSVLEGGTWSNLFINNSSSITLNNVTTMQNHITGYAATVDSGLDSETDGEENKLVLGMGIYIHDDQKLALTVNLNGDTQQYNWLSNEDDNRFGGNLTLARQIVFQDAYKDLIHNDGDTKYVNAAIAYQCMNLGSKKVLGVSLSKWFPVVSTPSIEIVREKKDIEYLTLKTDNLNVKGNSVKDALNLEQMLSQKGIPSYLHSVVLSMDIPFNVLASSAKHTGDDCPACLENFEKLPDVRAEFTSVVTYAD